MNVGWRAEAERFTGMVNNVAQKYTEIQRGTGKGKQGFKFEFRKEVEIRN